MTPSVPPASNLATREHPPRKEATARAVEILGPWVLNKGDDLMLRAVVERLGGAFTLAASSDLGAEGPLREPALRRVQWRPTLGQYALAARTGSMREGMALLRRRVKLALRSRADLRAEGIVEGRDLVALLDCSGFAYGDQWSVRRLRVRTQYYEKLKAQGSTLVMLPQALGPFEDPEVQGHAFSVLSQFDLIFARDEASRRHVLSLGIEPEIVSVSPDITHLLEGTSPPDSEAWATRVCVVPNARMLDRTAAAVSDRYTDFVVRAIRGVRKAGLEPWLVLHESNDVELAAEIRSRLNFEVPVFDEDARLTKGALGACYANIGSRYHSLVGSLSQGTPSIGTTWAHKYDEMFDEYGCAEWLISPHLDGTELDRKIRVFLEPATREALSDRLQRVARQQKQKVDAMWDQVEVVLRENGSVVHHEATAPN